ncbi:unnamed protein product, partial [Rotaria sp. Silwood1]
MRSSPN